VKPRIITTENKIVLHLEDRILSVGFSDKEIVMENTDLPLDYKKRVEELEKKFSESKKESLTSPCKDCLVKSCCKDECESLFLFLNHLADYVGDYTIDEIFYVRNNISPKLFELAIIMRKRNVRIDTSCYAPQ
jgi:radical SAM protein with 4Fe4S-binding SPASM domain